MNNKKHSKLGFSLIELSIVLLIISALMIGIIKGSDLINEARLSSARQATANSPVLQIKDLLLWFEPTMDNSFISSQIVDGGSISTWYDTSGVDFKNPKNVTQATAANQPQYVRNAINNLPALSFDGSSDYLTRSSFVFPYNSYQIFIVFRSFDISSSRDLLTLETAITHGMIIETQSGGIVRTVHRFPYSNANNPDSFLSSSGATAINQDYVLSYGRNAISSPTTSIIRLNGSTISTNTVTTSSFDNSSLNLNIGSLSNSSPSRFFNGYIAEIIIYSRSLSDQERSDIENYLGQKYNISIS